MKGIRVALLLITACVDPAPNVSTVESDICQSDRDCTHLPPTCAELGCPFAPSGLSWTWTPCPENQALCWCWANDGQARQCAHFTD